MEQMTQSQRDKKYNEWARKYPAVISLMFPVLSLIYVFFDNLALPSKSDVELFAKILLFFGTVIPALFFFYVFFVREIAVDVIEKVLYFLFGKPTIKLLLKDSKVLSDSRKDKIKELFKQKYQVDLSALGTPERSNTKYCKQLQEAVALAREDLRDNSILFEFNCVYGFFRNLSGGLLINLLAIVVIVAFVNYDNDNITLAIKWATYIQAALFLLSIIFTRTSGYRYAKRLYLVLK